MQPAAARNWLCLGLLVVLPYGAAGRAAEQEGPDQAGVSFNRDVRPLLADNCFACHGPDENHREAELRFDVREDAVADRGGYRAIAAGDPQASELWLRVTSDDAELRMPPPATGKSLSQREREILRRWILEGAPYQQHWSLIPPSRPAVPEAQREGWAENPVDRFVLRQLLRHALAPSPDADPRTLLRRLSFDLTGLPPTPQEVDQFVAEPSPAAYRQAVDRLLASRHFGERMALYWLDVVRYADSGGYHSDNHRDVAPYRDYVIRAFNENLPFDQFTVEQLAGDLLPEATTRQRIASGYNRLLQTTEEGGAQAQEYTAKYQADRVRNTAAAWLGITMGCCECHNHKFDPFSTREFYSFAAFFADIQEKAVGRQEQMAVPTVEQQQQLAELRSQLAPLRDALQQDTPELAAAQARWEELLREALRPVSSSDANTRPAEAAPSGGATSTAERDSSAPAAGVNSVQGASPGSDLPDAVREALAQPAEQRTAAQRDVLRGHFRSLAPELAPLRSQIDQLEQRLAAWEASFPLTLVSVSGPPRTVRVLPRGNWQDDSGDVVAPATPAALPPLQMPDRQTARLALARWMVARDNPLVARVFVNRLWKLLFGEGIVRSLADFGTQGQWPSHPELLDWLAVELQDSGWDVKQMVRLMVLSHTYRQASDSTDQLDQRDPTNRWFARQARFRLDAEFVRDNALAVSGLLSRKIGGGSVKPYQPAGYWQHLNFPKRTWQQEQGPDLYRRGLYTYWQRSFLHPSLAAFDAPSREECTVQRARSNTPLQALVLLNDPTYVEAARTLAGKVLEEGGPSFETRLACAFRQVLQRLPTERERDVLAELHTRHLAEYTGQPEQAAQLLAVGASPPPAGPAPELAAWTSLARVLLNLHETITRY